jgi:hypothetical protein
MNTGVTGSLIAPNFSLCEDYLRILRLKMPDLIETITLSGA